MDILSVVTRVPLLVFGVERHDDDFADRINYKYTVAILVIFAIIVTNRQFGTKQIHCWIPAYFTRNYEEYINDICWVSNTYYISLDQKLPEADQIRKSFELKYYQWVPFILLSQAFFFYIPHIAWRALSRRSGIDVRDIVEAAGNYKSVDKYENRQKYMSYMLTAVDQYVDDPRRRKESRTTLLIRRVLSAVCCISGKFLGNYLMVLYLFIKLAFITNCISQLFLLNLLLGHEFHKFGFELIEKIINGKGWDTGSRIFPKISMCDFRIREVGNPKVSHRYTVQCVLPINLFNQQIFSFIWFWYCLVLIINIYSLCVWSYRFLPSKRLRYIKRRIEIMRQALFWRHKNPLNFEQMPDESIEMHEFEKEIIEHFVHEYLESDGLFILRVLSSNTSDFVCTELIQELWKYYRKQRKFNRSSGDDDDDDDDDLIEDDEEFNKRSKSVNIKSIPKLTVASTQSRNTINEKKQIESNIEEEDEEEEEEGEEDLENDDKEDQEELYTNINTTNNNKNKMPNLNRNLKPRPPLPSDLTNRMPDSRLRGNNQNSAGNLRQKLRNKNIARPLAALSGQLANMYKSKKSSLNSSDETSAVSSSKYKLNRTISHDPNSLTSTNTYLVNSQLLPQNDKVLLATSRPTTKLAKLNRSNVSSNDENKSNKDLNKQKNDQEEEEEEEEENEDEQQSEFKTLDNSNESNEDKVKTHVVRLNSNTSNDEKKSRYLETET